MNRLLINAIFPGEPVSWQRVSGHGRHVFTPKETRQAQAALRRQLKCISPRLQPNTRARFGVQLVFSIAAAGRKDGDNMEKLVLDAFSNKIWADDSQIDECQWKVARSAAVPSTHMIVYTIE